jgi:hypothetical protein
LLGGEFLGTAADEQRAKDEQIRANRSHDITVTRV